MNDNIKRLLMSEAMIGLYYKIWTNCLFPENSKQMHAFWTHLNFNSIHILIRTLNSCFICWVDFAISHSVYKEFKL